MNSKIRPPFCASAFTLVELLVSMAVLTLLFVVMSQLVNSTTIVSTSSRKQLDADSEARVVFDRMLLDFEKMIKRKDVDFLFSKQSGGGNSGSNDKFFFYSEAPAYAPSSLSFKSPVALIGYRVNSSYQLERLGKMLTWSTTGSNPGSVVFLTFPPGSTTPIPGSTLAGSWSGTIGTSPLYNGTDNDYHVIAETVYRMEFCFQVKDLSSSNSLGAKYSNYPVAYFASGSTNSSTINSNAPTTSANSAKVGDRWYDSSGNHSYFCSAVDPTTQKPTWQPLGMDDVLGVVVTIALLDNTSRRVILDPTTNAIRSSLGDKMISAFSDSNNSDIQPSSGSPKLMSEIWLSSLNTPNFASNSVDPAFPRIAASQIRIYQRCFSLKAK